MTVLVDAMFSAPGPIVALATVAFWLSLKPHSRAVRRFAVLVAVVFLAASIYDVPSAVARVALTRGFHVFAAGDGPGGRTAIVVLGGGAQTVHGWDNAAFSAPSGDGLERVLEAARVYRLTRADWIIASGGVLNERDEPDGRIIRDALARLNVPTSRILVEADSRTTRDQAVLVAPILRSIAAERVIIVTSDVHMPRALWAFRAVGVTAIPAIAPDPHRADPLGSRLLPSSHGLGRSKQVSHELVGIAYYTVRRWLAF